MRAVDVVRNRVAAVASMVLEQAEAASALDWSRPLLPGTSPLGLTLWHLPRTTDWLLATIRGGPEVADDDVLYDRLPDPERFGFGTGLTPVAAAEAAAGVDRTALSRYVTAVAAHADEWLSTLSDDDLDEVAVEFVDRQQRRPAYSTPEALAEVTHLPTLPIGVLLMRPAVSHQLMHLGEIDLLVQQARA
jgi:hypothetical protein